LACVIIAPLGGPSSRGVDEDRDGGRVDRRHPPAQLAGRGAVAERLEVGEGDEERVGRQRVHPARLDHHDAAERGEPPAHRRHLVELLLVLHDARHRRGVREQVLDLGGRARGVEPDDHRPDRLQRQVGHHPLRAVVGEDGDAVAALDPQREEGARVTRDPLGVPLPRRLAPDPELLVAQGGARRVPGRAAQERGRRAGGELRGRAVGRPGWGGRRGRRRHALAPR
jgi:hypothetical protein